MKFISKLFKLFFSIILIAIIIYFLIVAFNNPKESVYYPIVQEKAANITKYYIYGRSLNIEGTLKTSLNKDEIEDISLVLNTQKTDTPIKTNYIIQSNNVIFKTSDLIDDGLILDNINPGDYFLLLKITYKDKKSPIYYTLKNLTKYKNVDYYTITNNKSNNYIKVSFLTQNYIAYTTLDVVKKKLPSDVYDIVIDPGHGGIDPGATYGGHEEAQINLDIAKKTKLELEKLGLKVKLTRDGNYNPGHLSGIEPYGKGGRVSIPYEVKAKYMISLHTNSADYKVRNGGLEVYIPSAIRLDLPKLIVSNIVKNTMIPYSTNPSYKEDSGIYVRNFSDVDINSVIEDARKNNYEPYYITSATPYYYIIRETGGIATHAYVDGRNSKYQKNIYYDSNIGTETYNIELGYINNANDIKKLTTMQLEYARGVAKALEEYLFKKE